MSLTDSPAPDAVLSVIIVIHTITVRDWDQMVDSFSYLLQLCRSMMVPFLATPPVACMELADFDCAYGVFR